FLSLRRAGAVLQQAFLRPDDGPEPRLHPESLRVLDRIPGAAVRRDRVRPSRGSDRPQIHLHADPAADGRRDVCGRPFAGIRDDWRLGDDPARCDAGAAGFGATRPVWRRARLSPRTIARRSAWVRTLLATSPTLTSAGAG